MPRFWSNLKYPMLTFLGVGVLLGVLLAGVVGGFGWQRISELQEEKKLLITRTEVLSGQIDSLRTSNESLKKKVSKVRIVKPDGEILETESSELESSKEVVEQVKEAYRKELREELLEEAKTLQKSSARASVGVAISRDGKYSARASYGILGPIHLGLQLQQDLAGWLSLEFHF